MRDMDTRRAVPADLAEVSAIYALEALHGHATFDLEPRPDAAWQERLAADGPGNHFIVAVHEDRVVGYATSGPYRPKPAYAHTRETTIYVAPGHQGSGFGRRLYDDLLARCAADGVHLAVAAVALPNPGSVALHRACGFEEVGTMREVGRKFDRWVDVLWLQKLLS
jgi:L-amino acid N-acyltransferase YncA